jgi:hypothetical protein
MSVFYCVVCCQVEVSATGRSLVQRSLPTVVCVNEFDYESLVGRDSSVCIAIRYGLDGPGIESRWRLDFRHPSA